MGAALEVEAQVKQICTGDAVLTLIAQETVANITGLQLNTRLQIISL